MICASCGQPLPGDDADSIAQRYRLSRSERVVFEAVVKANGRMVTRDHLIDLLWGMDPNGGPDGPITVLRTFVSHANTKLRPAGLRIKSVWGQGYSLARDAAAPSAGREAGR